VSSQRAKTANPVARPSIDSTRTRREAARALNEALDCALLGYPSAEWQRVLELGREHDVISLADRVRLRGMRLAKSHALHRSRILHAADGLVLAAYCHAARAGWLCGFCDASAMLRGEARGVGIGAVVLDGRGRIVAQVSRRTADCEPFEAEIAALEATLDAAAGLDAPRIRVHTDCDALVALWLEHRRDPRLRGVRERAGRLRGFQLHSLPRRHNRTAHRLARSGASG
jgi:ribonuclease HI